MPRELLLFLTTYFCIQPKSIIMMVDVLVGVVIEFEQPEYSVFENNGSVEVCAVIVEGGLERNITVTIFTRNGRAIGEGYNEL